MKSLRVATAMVAVFALGIVGGCAKSSNNQGASGDESESSAGKKVAFVPKLQGIPFFEAMNRGGKEAASELGFTWIYKGATTADPAAQAEVVRSLVQQRVDTIIVAPNDPDSMAPVLKDAKDKGIHVMTADTDSPSSVREVFANQATGDSLGDAMTDQITKAMGDKGKMAIVSCGQTASNLNMWIDRIKENIAKDHPDVEIVDVVYADEDQDKAVTMAKNLMSAHPDLTGLVGPCTTAAPGVAQAVTETNKIGKVFTIGVGTPKAMAPYLKSGASTASVLWDVEAAGYMAAWAGNMIANNEKFKEENTAGRLTGVKYISSDQMLVLGDPLILTESNVDNYDY